MVTIHPPFVDLSITPLVDGGGVCAAAPELGVAFVAAGGRVRAFDRTGRELLAIDVAPAKNARHRHDDASAIRCLSFERGVLVVGILDEVVAYDVDVAAARATLRFRSEPLPSLVTLVGFRPGGFFALTTSPGDAVDLDERGRRAEASPLPLERDAEDEDAAAAGPLLGELAALWERLLAVEEKHDKLGAGDTEISESVAFECLEIYQRGSPPPDSLDWQLYEDRDEEKLARACADLDAAAVPMLELLARATKEEPASARAFLRDHVGVDPDRTDLVDEAGPIEGDPPATPPAPLPLGAQPLGAGIVVVPFLSGRACLASQRALEATLGTERKLVLKLAFDARGTHLLVENTGGADVVELATQRQWPITTTSQAYGFAMDADGFVLAQRQDCVSVFSLDGAHVRDVAGATLGPNDSWRPLQGFAIVKQDKQGLVVEDAHGAIVMTHRGRKAELQAFHAESKTYVVTDAKGTYVYRAGTAAPIWSGSRVASGAQCSAKLLAFRDEADMAAVVLVELATGATRVLKSGFSLEGVIDDVAYGSSIDAPYSAVLVVDMHGTRARVGEDAKVVAANRQLVVVCERREPSFTIVDRATWTPLLEPRCREPVSTAALSDDGVLALAFSYSDLIETLRVTPGSA